MTTQIPGRTNDDLLGKKGGRGFPYCVLMDGAGNVLKELRPSTEAEFVSGFKPVKLLFDARVAVARKKSKTNKHNLMLMESVFKPNERAFKKLRNIAKKKGINEDIRDLFQSMIKSWPIRKTVEDTQKAIDAARKTRNQDAMSSAEKAQQAKMYQLYKRGVILEDSSVEYFYTYWGGIVEVSIQRGDKKAGNAALDALEEKYADNPRALAQFKKQRQQLQ